MVFAATRGTASSAVPAGASAGDPAGAPCPGIGTQPCHRRAADRRFDAGTESERSASSVPLGSADMSAFNKIPRQALSGLTGVTVFSDVVTAGVLTHSRRAGGT